MNINCKKPKRLIKHIIKYIFNIRGTTLMDNIQLFTKIPIINGFNYILYRLGIPRNFSCKNNLILVKYRDKIYNNLKFLIRPCSGDLI